ncbi:GMP synthase [glutamine-hydrolyzing] [Polytolypa hystricis UAMH7299]|uniref:GMP synthase (glutamine-hydrolyzing) n=1 Tax=Polytolypa hystricis (strain UAMH7299) TaxID=1447883 RepID=A0A2B7X3I8_POLH7|nr:GMP synthase [glutamine-hydrolyzing] [Polytolypa hystricis UAMH7299]
MDAEKPPHSVFDTILTLDFGSQYTHLITRRLVSIPHLRELNVYSEMLPCTQKLADLPWKPKGIILSGGPYSVYEEGAPHIDPAFFELGVPILGICYGLQELAYHLAKDNVGAGTAREYGHADLNARKLDDQGDVDRLFAGLEENMKVWMSHGDKLVKLPEGFHTIATTSNSEYAGIAHKTKPIYGIQFHPEVTHTPDGIKLLKNFAVDICGVQQSWTMANFVEQEITRIRKLVGPTDHVLGAVSGGVDSTVASKLMKEAIGDRFHAVLVNNGCMRLNECDQVQKTLGEHLGVNLTVVDASKLFLDGLKGVTDPETKRKFIGGKFIDVFEAEALKIEASVEHTGAKVKWFLQGTLYPDVIESLSFKGPSATIKTHHNVGGLPARMQAGGDGLQLIEPLRELFKDEVRQLGRELGIHNDLVMRHPFPGPGIAIRVLGEVTPERVEIARQADHIFISMIREAGLYDKIAQAYAALDPTKAVGVMGDKRVHAEMIILRAVETTDFMTCTAYPFSHEFLSRASTRIINEIHGGKSPLTPPHNHLPYLSNLQELPQINQLFPRSFAKQKIAN